MDRLSKAAIGFSGLVDSVEALLKERHPPVLKTETVTATPLRVICVCG